MPHTQYIKVQVGDYEAITSNPDEIPVSINYSLEDNSDFQSKESGMAFDITTPATLENSKTANSFHNPSIEDLTDGEIFRSIQSARIEANGHELLVGKGLLKSAEHNSRPISYTWNIWGDNADWLIDLKETTLFDLLKHISFVFSKVNIQASWAFNGLSEALPYVFAPIRYRDPFNGYSTVDGESVPNDDNVAVDYMRPSISKYWLLYWMFKSVGYKLESSFFNTNYYRRMVMPWTWGNFLNSEGTRLDIHKFLAKSLHDVHFSGDYTGIWDLLVSNDSTDGAYDNNGTPGDYTYVPTATMRWQYNTPHYGILSATFSITLSLNAKVDMGSNLKNSHVQVRIQWFKNGVMTDCGWGAFNSNGNLMMQLDSSGITANYFIGNESQWFTTTVNPADNAGAGTIITAKVWLLCDEASGGAAWCYANVLEFKLDYFKIPLGGTIDLENYTGLKKYKALDFLAGEVDLYDLSFNTDPVAKRVVIEPTHPYSLTNDFSTKQDGYFKDDFLDWNNKSDYSKNWQMQLYSDGEREQLLKFKEDNNDGLLKLIQDRNVITLGACKYALPERFKAGAKERENRFFGATMHYEVDQFKTLGTGSNTDIAPQMVCIVPENISNTSKDEASNTFLPKSAYYKGNITGVGAWKFDGTVLQTYPYLFAVNYKDGGQNDPILSYSDEKIKSGSSFVVGKGLLKRYFLQRFAIMRNGQWYKVWMRLVNYDVAGQLHREFKSLAGHKWELISIDGYQPLKDESTGCNIRKWVPISAKDNSAVFPSADSILGDDNMEQLDMKYSQLKCLTTDIPK